MSDFARQAAKPSNFGLPWGADRQSFERVWARVSVLMALRDFGAECVAIAYRPEGVP